MTPADLLPYHSQSGLFGTVHGSSQSKIILILLHGWCCQASDYKRLLQAFDTLHAEFRSISIDLPGHGSTPKEVCAPNVEAYGTIIADLISEVSTSNDVSFLVGHSMSCRIVLEAWSVAQSRRLSSVQGVVFLDGSNFKLKPALSPFDKEDPARPKFSQEDVTRSKAAMFDSMFSTATPKEFRDATIQHLQTRDTTYTLTLRRSYLEYDFTRSDNELSAFDKIGGRLLSLQSTNIDTPRGRVPMLEGETSAFMRYIQERVSGAQQIVIPDSAHFPHVDCPGVVAKAIIDFVQDTLRAERTLQMEQGRW